MRRPIFTILHSPLVDGAFAVWIVAFAAAFVMTGYIVSKDGAKMKKQGLGYLSSFFIERRRESRILLALYLVMYSIFIGMFVYGLQFRK